MTTGAATARAYANIAFVKYWGNRDATLRLPLNSSLSMNLSAAHATTTVAFVATAREDEITLNASPATAAVRGRIVRHLDRLRRVAGIESRATVASENSFPMATGIASSAAGFAALTVAAAAAAAMELTERELSRLARLASGSAARSVPGGFVEWCAADRDQDSYAWSVAPPHHWDLRDLVAVVSRTPKQWSSSEGHRAAESSFLLPCRLQDVEQRLPAVRRAVAERDLSALGPLVEAEALSLHAVALTGEPSLLYLAPGTVEVLHGVRRWRREGLAVYFTLDAGPNVHILCEASDAPRVRGLLTDLAAVEEVIANAPAPGAHLLPALAGDDARAARHPHGDAEAPCHPT